MLHQCLSSCPGCTVELEDMAPLHSYRHAQDPDGKARVLDPFESDLSGAVTSSWL